VVYPEIVYRRYGKDGARVHEAELKIAMRFWYPDQLDALVTAHGYRVTSRWGGYAGEPWGDGNELVIEFERSGQKTSP
ncbi:MAG TPA: hypothetical protein VKT77_05540, partial [Chthonomonadaceae bacterium]|nr:hypothetical protein [Chthonomonadaceae bacterium]